MTNHRPYTKFFTSKKNRIAFPAFYEGFPNQTGNPAFAAFLEIMASSSSSSRFKVINAVEKFIEGQKYQEKQN